MAILSVSSPKQKIPGSPKNQNCSRIAEDYSVLAARQVNPITLIKATAGTKSLNPYTSTSSRQHPKKPGDPRGTALAKLSELFPLCGGQTPSEGEGDPRRLAPKPFPDSISDPFGGGGRPRRLAQKALPTRSRPLGGGRPRRLAPKGPSPTRSSLSSYLSFIR